MVDRDRFGIAKLFPTVGKKWLARWDNTHKRTIHRDNWDSYDPNFGFHYVPTPDDRTLVIDGSGVATMPEEMKGQSWSPEARRLFVKGPWTNTEMTIYARWRKKIWDTFQLRSRSNHHGTKNMPYGYDAKLDRSCGFGNYECIWGNGITSTARSRISVEVIHSLYSNVVAGGASSAPAQNIWMGFKFVTRTVKDNAIKCEAYTDKGDITNNWKKECEFTFTNSNTTIPPLNDEKKSNAAYCADKGDKISGEYMKHIVWLNPGYWNFIRINGGYDVQVKGFSVREIAPL